MGDKLTNRKWGGWREIREFHEQNQRLAVVNSESGNRTLTIVSVTPDAITTTESIPAHAEILLRTKIHIVAIPETHIPYGQNYMTNGY